MKWPESSMRPKRTALVYGTCILATMVLALLVNGNVMVSLAVICLAVLAACALINPAVLAPLVLIGASLFARPNILSADFAGVSVALFLAAAVVALAQDSRASSAEERPDWRVPVWVGIALGLASLTLVLAGSVTDVVQLVRGPALVLAGLVSAAFVLRDSRRRVLVAKLFIVLVAGFSVSYAITVFIWAIQGVGSWQIGSIDTGVSPEPQPVFAPFTPTVGTRLVPGGLLVPRLTGLGREPGWMGLYASAAFFLAPLVGWRRPLLRAVLLVGLIGTFSTAAFAIFIVVSAYVVFGRARDGRSAAATGLLRVAGVGATALALWAAYNTPVLGIDDKTSQDALSVSLRADATQAGIAALRSNFLLGGGATDVVGGVNLIASIALYGLPFALAIGFALWAPRRGHENPGLTTAPIGIIFATLLTSQPAADSTWVFILAMTVYAASKTACASMPSPTLSRSRHHVLSTSKRDALLSYE